MNRGSTEWFVSAAVLLLKVLLVPVSGAAAAAAAACEAGITVVGKTRSASSVTTIPRRSIKLHTPRHCSHFQFCFQPASFLAVYLKKALTTMTKHIFCRAFALSVAQLAVPKC